MDSLTRAREVLGEVMKSPASDFYRGLYAGNSAAALAAAGGPWEEVPTLTRAYITAVPFFKRLYCKLNEVEAVRPTSGTTNRTLTLFPRSIWNKHYERPWFGASGARVKRMATFSGGHFIYDSNFRSYGIDSLQLSPSDIELSAALMERYKPEALAGFPYALSALAPKLSSAVRGRIQSLQIFGERSTALERQYLKTFFPVPFFFEYGSVDLQSFAGDTCEAAARAGEPYVHPSPEHVHLELIDEEGKPITEPGRVGEIVVTVLWPVGFPLIRYRTGDAGRFVRMHCPCGMPTPLLSVEGRLEVDRVRIRGGELNVAEVDRVLALFSSSLEGYTFELHISEGVEGDALKPRVSIACACKGDPAALARDIALNLRVAPQKTYAQGVAAGEYAPLRVLNRPEAAASVKRVRIVRD